MFVDFLFVDVKVFLGYNWVCKVCFWGLERFCSVLFDIWSIWYIGGNVWLDVERLVWNYLV